MQTQKKIFSTNPHGKNVLCLSSQSKEDKNNIIWNRIKADCKNIGV